MKRRSTPRGDKSTKSAKAQLADPTGADGEAVAMAGADGDALEQDGENADTAGGSNGQLLDAEGEIALMVLATGDVAKRAYELFLARGEGHGQDLDDWLAAERELREAQQNSQE